MDDTVYRISCQNNMTGLCNDFHGIIDCIIDKRLYGHLRKLCIKNIGRDFFLIVQTFLIKPDLLDRNIVVYDMQLMSDGKISVLVTECGAQQIAESLYHFGNVCRTDRFGTPVDRFECIVQEMRVDLAFQCFQAGILCQDLIDIVLPDQALYLHGHLIKLPVQDPCLIHTVSIGFL